MNEPLNGVRYLINNPAPVREYLLGHLQMTGLALLIALLIATPLGFLIARRRWLAGPILGALGILYTVPSLALIILLIPRFGLNRRSVVIALVVYAQVILVRNIAAGLGAVDPAIVEAARGMGMTQGEILMRIELPLALPVIVAGLRIATVTVISVAVVAAYVNAGGLGTLIFSGISNDHAPKIWTGALTACVLAVIADLSLARLEYWLRARSA